MLPFQANFGGEQNVIATANLHICHADLALARPAAPC